MAKHPKKDILAEAIADAKKVRQTAFEHAKIQMQEAFMPKLQNVFKEKMTKTNINFVENKWDITKLPYSPQDCFDIYNKSILLFVVEETLV